jgi:hypothetical protein
MKIAKPAPHDEGRVVAAFSNPIYSSNPNYETEGETDTDAAYDNAGYLDVDHVAVDETLYDDM